jgi:hypothetical protein
MVPTAVANGVVIDPRDERAQKMWWSTLVRPAGFAGTLPNGERLQVSTVFLHRLSFSD